METRQSAVLIVDDEPEICAMVAFDLRDAGYETAVATSAEEALALASSRAFDAIISDIRMPGASGVELLRRVMATTAVKPVVLFMTAFSDLPLEEALHLGAEAVVGKPLNLPALLELLARALEERDARWSTPKEPRKAAVRSIEVSAEGLASQTFNIGRNGAFVALPPQTLPRVGAEIGFRVHLDGDGAIEGRGIVRWVRRAEGPLPTGIGLEFLTLEDGCRAEVIAHIERAQLLPAIPRN